jgi:hypothetical protein
MHIGGAEVRFHSFLISIVASFMLWPLLYVGPVAGVNVLEKKGNPLPVPRNELGIVFTAARPTI